MGVFGAVFGCSGDVGFSVPLLGVCSGADGFMLACISGCRGVIGCKVATGGVLCAKKFSLLGLMVGASATKFALRTKNGTKSVFRGVLGEFFAEMPVEGLCWAKFFAPTGAVPRTCRRCGALQAGCGGGFAALEAGCRGISGVSQL